MRSRTRTNRCIYNTERRFLSISDLSLYPSSFHPRRRVVRRNSRRYFFSIFNNNENDKNIDDRDTKNTIRNNINENKYDDDDHWENKYRTPITTTSDEMIWNNEFRHESQRTRHHLPDVDDIKREIQDNINNIWTTSTSSSPPPEYGPTGKFLYRFELLEVGTGTENEEIYRRVYQRYSSKESTMEPSSSQLVLELEPNMEIVSMSLTPDESCVAYLVHDERTGISSTRIRNIDSGMESTLSTELLFSSTHQNNDVASTSTSPISLEWGPVLQRKKEKDDCDYYYQSLYFVLADNQGRPNRVVGWKVDPSLLSIATGPMMVYQNDDPTVFVDVQRTKGCHYIAIRAMSKSSNEIFLCSDPTVKEPLLLVKPRRNGVLYHIDVGVDQDLVMLTSNEQQNHGDYSLTEISVDSLPLISHTNDKDSDYNGDDHEDDEGRNFFIEDIDLFRDHIVLYERSKKNGDQRIRVRHRRDVFRLQEDAMSTLTSSSSSSLTREHKALEETIVDLSSSSLLENNNCKAVPLWSKLSPVGNMCFDVNFFRFELESPVSPGAVYEYNFDTKKSKNISGASNSSASSITSADNALVKEKVVVESIDGTDVPLSLFYNQNRDVSSSSHPTQKAKNVVLVGYGAYGEPTDLSYNPGWRPLLDRGVVLAFAHTRGGGDLGRAWYLAGCRENKVRGIEDYEACAKYLRYNRFEGASLTGKVFSAGGILLGAAVNRHPGLFDKVVLTNAFVDVLSTMNNSNLFLTEHEYDEFGNPSADPKVDTTIRSYCPIYNLKPELQTSTRFLLIGTLDDPNVPAHRNAILYFKKLVRNIGKESGGSNNEITMENNNHQRVFLEVQSEGGHNFSSKNRIEVIALEDAFILQ
jgi:protease II